MKIDALRVAAFRRFADPAAIEDFADGVNVLAGPNEMGKSTFFHALEAAFVVRHKVSGTVLDAMRPFAGGEPLVEADFSLNGNRWRIRKQFGRGSAAILTDLTAGRVAARNAEAEDQLGRLIGRAGDLQGPIGLVWVKQQRTLHAPDPDVDYVSGKEKPRGERNALQDAIGREVETAAGGEALERVRQLTEAALDLYLTPTRNAAKKNGPLDSARRKRDETRAALDLAERAAAAAEQRLQAIAAASAEFAALSAPELAARRQHDLAQLEAELASEVQRRAEFDVAREALKARLSEAESARQSLAAERARAERLSNLDQQRSLAFDLEAQIAALAASLNSDGATPARLQQLSRAAHARDVADAGLQGEAARIEVRVEPAGAGLVRIDGHVIAGQARHDVPESADIVIDGIAAIRVTAAGAERTAAARQSRDAAGLEIAEILVAIGAAAIGEARDRAEARSRKAEELDRMRAKLSGVAPQGSAAIAKEFDRLLASIPPEGGVAALEDNVNSRAAAAHVMRERVDGLMSTILSDEAFRARSAKLDAARNAEASTARELARLTMRIENLKSEQAGADEDGRAGQVAALSGEYERHDGEVKRLEAEGKALLMLARTLEAIEAKARDAFFEPVTRRVQPYLNEVFGSAGLGFKDAFAIDGLTRDGQRQDFAVLSDGTREQLSVLVRLGFAELLAARGVSVPLVLDDPLVYSDDERLGKICRVLQAASLRSPAAGSEPRGLQIIVLTCRATAFQTLSGRRVSVTAWRPDV
ncbi:MAG: hypothetical protein ABL893_03875 [Hyphomicrobium sp.]